MSCSLTIRRVAGSSVEVACSLNTREQVNRWAVLGGVCCVLHMWQWVCEPEIYNFLFFRSCEWKVKNIRWEFVGLFEKCWCHKYYWNYYDFHCYFLNVITTVVSIIIITIIIISNNILNVTLVFCNSCPLTLELHYSILLPSVFLMCLFICFVFMCCHFPFSSLFASKDSWSSTNTLWPCFDLVFFPLTPPYPTPIPTPVFPFAKNSVIVIITFFSSLSSSCGSCPDLFSFPRCVMWLPP